MNIKGDTIIATSTTNISVGTSSIRARRNIIESSTNSGKSNILLKNTPDNIVRSSMMNTPTIG